MSPVVRLSTNAHLANIEISASRTPDLVDVAVGSHDIWFQPDLRLAPQLTAPEHLAPQTQVSDQVFLDSRAALIADLRASPTALTTSDLLSIAEERGFPERFSPELSILEKLGVPVFRTTAAVQPRTEWDFLDGNLQPTGQRFSGDLSNVCVQALRAAVALDSLRFLNVRGFDPHAHEQLVGDAILLKALKAGEILDRKAAERSLLQPGLADTAQRLRARCEHYATSGVLSAEEAGRVLQIALSTVGVAGYQRFLRLDSQGGFRIVGDPGLRLIRAFDDCTTTLDPDLPAAPVLFGFSPPADKIVVISKRRGEGLLGTQLLHDPQNQEGVPIVRKVTPGTAVPGALTMGQAQDLLSSCNLSSLALTWGLASTEDSPASIVQALTLRLGSLGA